jgi:diguanylate cyclase (GGDEF)-like protein
LLLVIGQDVTEHLERQASLNQASNFDALTGLLTRSAFMQRVSSGMAQLQPLTLVLLDVDHLKRTNDTDGHAAGNEVIKHVAARLRAVQSPHTITARLGGDEFALVRFGTGQDTDLHSVVNGLCQPVRLKPTTWPCSASAGIASDAVGVPFDELYLWADTALSMSKAAGGGRARVFDAATRGELQRRASIVNLTRRAVTSGNVIPYYQPKVDLVSGHIVGFEALLRVRFPDASMHTATAVTAALQEPGLATEIDRAMLERVLADVRLWHEQGASRPVAVNLSNGDVRQPGFADRFLAALSVAGVTPQCIEAEITETVLLEGTDSVTEETLRTLSAAGISIALDDFGTGHASLSHLKRFPIDVIKIDRQFIRNLPVDPSDRAIVQAMIGLGQALGMDVVAEGIERPDQAEFLRAEGCRTGQGFLFSPAVAQREAHGMAVRGTTIAS